MGELTRKQKLFVKEYVKTGHGVDSALKAYDTKDYSTAGNIASENLEKPKIQNALMEALPDEILAEVHREGLYATREYFNTKGELQGDIADFAVRAKYLDLAYKIKGAYAPEKKLTVNVDMDSTPEIEEATKVLNEYFRSNRSGDGETSSAVDTQT